MVGLQPLTAALEAGLTLTRGSWRVCRTAVLQAISGGIGARGHTDELWDEISKTRRVLDLVTARWARNECVTGWSGYLLDAAIAPVRISSG